MESTEDDQAQEELQELGQLIDQVRVKVHRLCNLNLNPDHQIDLANHLDDLLDLALK